MAQSNVMREPSMEEILASIRRIIENNDQPETLGSGNAPAEMPEAANDIHLTVDEEIVEFQAPDFVNELPVVPVVEPPVERVQQDALSLSQDVAGGHRPMSLADVAARVKAASERRVVPGNSNGWMPEGILPVEHDPVIVDQPTPSSMNESVTFEHENTVEQEDTAASASSDMPAELQHDLSMTPVSAATTSIVSQHIGERVARSFDELAKAIGASSRTLDDIASEMLRPMLQEWLDDNLPTLVERLVREEIERVARGPRR